MYRVSLVIPCYNEEQSLPRLIAHCESAFKDKDVEVILVDNGSTDHSASVIRQVVTESFVRCVRVEENQGYGFGILAGLREAQGNYLSWTHADMQTDPADLLQALALVVPTGGDRCFIKGKRYGRPLFDRFFTAGMSLFETLLLGVKMNDINAQPTVFSKAFFLTWEQPPRDFSLDLYAYYMAKKHGLEIKRFPVLFADREHGVSHWNTSIRSKIKFITRTMRYSFNLRKELTHARHSTST